MVERNAGCVNVMCVGFFRWGIGHWPCLFASNKASKKVAAEKRLSCRLPPRHSFVNSEYYRAVDGPGGHTEIQTRGRLGLSLCTILKCSQTLPVVLNLLLWTMPAGHAQGNTVAALAQPNLVSLSVAGIPPVITSAGGGYMDLIVREMLARADIDYQFVKTPARRGVFDAAEGTIHGVSIPHADLREIYPTLIPMPEPVLPLEFAGIFLRDDIAITKPEDFREYSVAHIRGWKQAEDLFAGHGNVEQVRRPFLLTEMLALGRVDLVFFSTPTTKHIAEEVELKG